MVFGETKDTHLCETNFLQKKYRKIVDKAKNQRRKEWCANIRNIFFINITHTKNKNITFGREMQHSLIFLPFSLFLFLWSMKYEVWTHRIPLIDSITKKNIEKFINLIQNAVFNRKEVPNENSNKANYIFLDEAIRVCMLYVRGGVLCACLRLTLSEVM